MHAGQEVLSRRGVQRHLDTAFRQKSGAAKMWAIVNQTPFKADSTWAREKSGLHQWVVAVKGTFDIAADGGISLAEEQSDPLLAPEYTGEAGLSSLLYDADLALPKPTTDIVLNCTAYAPLGRPSTSFLASIRVGPIQKTLRVVGNRWWKNGASGGTPSTMEPVTRVPVVYERAYGGYDRTDPDPARQRMDSRNPCGRGVVAQLHNRIGQPLPNFEYPDKDIEKTGPAGFGALDSFWSPRREYAGTYDKAWEEKRLPLLPLDWDPRALLCAPPDQRPDDYLRGGEIVELTNLTPAGRLSFRLPRVYLTFETRVRQRTEAHRSHLATVIIEPDFPRVIMVWLTSLACEADGDYLEETIVGQKILIK
jgi:hypothetical protein